MFGLLSLGLLTLEVYLAMSAATSAEAGGVRKSPARTELEDPDKGSFCWTAGKNKPIFFFRKKKKYPIYLHGILNVLALVCLI